MPNMIRTFTAYFLLLASLAIHAEPQPRIVGGVESAENSWSFMSALMFKNAGLTIASGEQFKAFFMQGTPTKDFSADLINCEQGFTQCEGVKNKVCLIERGETLFTEKVLNCQAGGGSAAIIYNNVDGLFLGQAEASIPAVSVSRATGLTLLNHLNENINFGFLDDIPTFSFCGGSYIGGKWVITAAHCVEDATAPSIVINIGGHNLETDHENVIDVVNIFVHKEYNTDTLNNDIAIIELKTEPTGVTPIILADTTILDAAIENLSEVTTIGRGLQIPLVGGIEPEPELPDPNLFEVQLSLVNNETCNSVMHDLISDDMVCAGNLDGGVGSCKGDSGGPLILQLSNKNYLVGVTSWGFGCAQPGTYGVFNRPAFFKGIIDTVTKYQAQTTFISTNPKTGGGGSWNIQTLLFLVLASLFFIGIRKYYSVRKNQCY